MSLKPEPGKVGYITGKYSKTENPTNEEFCQMVKDFQEWINQKAEEIQELRPDIAMFPFKERDGKYDKEIGGFIQINTISSPPEFNGGKTFLPSWHSKNKNN